MSRVLLLCFVHGFKGTDNSFHEFPKDLSAQVKAQLPDHRVESVVYPKYETSGELGQASQTLLDWTRERVMDLRKAHCEKPWPPNDRDVGVIFVAHSMGGFVAADALFLAINEREANKNKDDSEVNQLFPLIQGILAFDTPYNGLARSMFVYGAFSNYQKVSTVFNAMTALSAAAPMTLARLGAARNAASSAVASTSGSRWATWQLLAVRTGTVGAIAAGGVAAYTHREAIMKGLKSARNLNKDSIAQGYRNTKDTLGQGLAYINRGNVGKSFAYLSDHFVFVGALLKQKELCRRLERMGSLKGVGMHDVYCSLGENGYWSGGYFVPERTFCAIPEPNHSAYSMFSREVMSDLDDEIQAHVSMFSPEKHAGYEKMTENAAGFVREWFLKEEQIVDDERFREPPSEEKAEDHAVDEVLERDDGDVSAAEKIPEPEGEKQNDDLPDESPLDIAAASSLVPVPGSEGGLVQDTNVAEGDDDGKKTYIQHLMQLAQHAGTEAKGWWPAKIPNMPNMPSVSIPGTNFLTKQTPTESEAPKAESEGPKTENETSKDETATEKPTESSETQPEVEASAPEATKPKTETAAESQPGSEAPEAKKGMGFKMPDIIGSLKGSK